MPTVVIGTDEFRALVALERKARGLPDLPLVIPAHPIGGLRPPLVTAKAADMVEGVVRAVTGAGAP